MRFYENLIKIIPYFLEKQNLREIYGYAWLPLSLLERTTTHEGSKLELLMIKMFGALYSIPNVCSMDSNWKNLIRTYENIN